MSSPPKTVPPTMVAAGLLACLLVGFGTQFLATQTGDEAGRLAIYFEDGPFIADTSVRNGTTFLSVIELVRRMTLPYTDATATETLTIRGPGATLEIRNGSTTLTLGTRSIEMGAPASRESGRWWVPMEFLTLGLADASGVRFRYDDPSPRVFAGTVVPTLLDMNAAQTEAGTRLTIRTGQSVNVRVQQDPAANRVVLSIDPSPLDPTREELEYRDGSIRAVRFDDSEGVARIVIDTTEQLANVRLVPTDENRTFHLDFVPENTPPETVTGQAATSPDPLSSAGTARVIVIDPGHGGLDNGASAHGILEKDLTLAFARRLRSALLSRFDATVIMTRDDDREMSQEERTTIANNSAGDLLIGLHVGYSFDRTESSSSLFVMHPIPGRDGEAPSEEALFQPWYRAYMQTGAESRRFAEILHRNLDSAIRRWEFPVRQAPVGLLASTTMPAAIVELGNANNEGDLAMLNDPDVQDRIIGAILDTIGTYGGGT